MGVLKIEEFSLAIIGILKQYLLIPAYTIQRPTGYRTEDIPLPLIRVSSAPQCFTCAEP